MAYGFRGSVHGYLAPLPLLKQNRVKVTSKCRLICMCRVQDATEISPHDNQQSKKQCGKVHVSRVPFKDVTSCHDLSLGQNIRQTNSGRKRVFWLTVSVHHRGEALMEWLHPEHCTL